MSMCYFLFDFPFLIQDKQGNPRGNVSASFVATPAVASSGK